MGLAIAVPGRGPARTGGRLPAFAAGGHPDLPRARGVRRDRTGRRHQFKDLLSEYWAPILRLVGLVVALNVVNYTLLTYMPTYLERTIGLSSSHSLIVPVIGMLSMMVFLPLSGHISDRVGRKPMWWLSLIGLFIAGVPMFLLMSTNVVGAIIGFAVLGLLYVPQLSTISATFPAMFPTQVRYAGFAIAYNVSTSLFGGTAPAINDWLVNKTGDHLVPAYYMMVACVIGMIALIKVPETARCPIGGTEIPGTPEAPPQLDYEIEADARHVVRVISRPVAGRPDRSSAQSAADVDDFAHWVVLVAVGNRQAVADEQLRPDHAGHLPALGAQIVSGRMPFAVVDQRTACPCSTPSG